MEINSMDVVQILRAQYHAGLSMLRQAVELLPGRNVG